MNLRPIFFFALAYLTAPLAAWADANPDFDDDAKPILKAQPGLLQYVESKFDVKDTGTAKYPGDDDRPPLPPFIFKARPLGSSGPYNLRLLIQPGPVNHILNVVDMTRVHLTNPPQAAPPSQPAVANQPAPPQAAPPSAPAPSASAPAEVSQTQPAAPSASGPTSDTPSGPIVGNGTQAAPLPPPPSSTPSLEPPPDPAPAGQ